MGKIIDTQWSKEYKFIEKLKKTAGLTTEKTKNGLVILKPKFDSTKHYYPVETQKRKIVLHYTVGSCQAAYDSLTGTEKVSVQYLVARDGTIINLFPDKYWSYHLGSGAIGGNANMSKESIGIELANYGPLSRKDYELHTWYSTDKKPDVYCDIGDTNHYFMVNGGYRGYTYFAKPTHEQLEAVDGLIKYLCEKYNIPEAKLNKDKRYKVFSNAAMAKNFTGICTHANFRSDGKWDIGPGFFSED